jgi:hypothetical protein
MLISRHSHWTKQRGSISTGSEHTLAVLGSSTQEVASPSQCHTFATVRSGVPVTLDPRTSVLTLGSRIQLRLL